MRSKGFTTSIAAAAILSGALLAAPAQAQSSASFAALQGLDAQVLSPQEMDAIAGELNAYDIAAALYAKATGLAQYPKLQAAVVKLADYYLNNATAINAFFARLGILTPCQTGCPK